MKPERKIGGTAVLLMILTTLVYSQTKPNPVKVKVVDVIPANMSGESNQDSEPFLSVDLSDTSRMVISAFTPDSSNRDSLSAPVFLSLDGGDTWSPKSSIPIAVVTADITHAFVRNGILHAGALELTDTPQGPRPDLLRLTAQDPALAKLMETLKPREDVDQPFVTTVMGNPRDYVYIGENYLGGQVDATATVEVSSDGGDNFRPTLLEKRTVAMQDGPSIRLAIARDGKAYAAFFGWRKFRQVDRKEGWVTSDVVLMRDDKRGIGVSPFSDLKDVSDHLPGQIVAKNVSIHWSNKPTLGQERTGSSLSLAVDPNKSSIVYIAWADNMAPNKEYTVHVRKSEDSGKSWREIKHIENTTCPALAVADNGTLGFLYQTLNVSGGTSRWETHLEQTTDDFGSPSEDLLLANVPANLPLQFLPYLGDYNFLLAIGRDFRGVFSANNFPDSNNFPFGVTYLRMADLKNHILLDDNKTKIDPSIDPFYFSAFVKDNPARAWSAPPVLSMAQKPEPTTTPANSQDGRRESTQEKGKADSGVDLKAHLDAVDVVMVGRVVSTRDASQTFTASGGTLSAIPESRQRISEHDPVWREAIIQVERPVKGVVKDQKLVVRYPSSADVMWRNYPKFQEGEEELFLLKRGRAAGGALQSLSNGAPLFAPPTKQDVLSKDQIEKVIKLLTE